MTTQETCWPDGKRIAVAVGVLFETWAEGKAPGYFPRTTTLKLGAVDHGGIRWAEYAGRIIRKATANVLKSNPSGCIYLMKTGRRRSSQ